MKLTIAIIDQNKIYLKRLTKYFNDNYNDRVGLCAFSTILSFFSFAEKNRVDFIIANEACNFEEIEKKLDDNSLLIKLLEYPTETNEKYERVFKYISCDELYRYILDVASERLEISENSDKKELKVSVIVSVQNYKREFISALAYAFNQKEKVVFLDLTRFAALNSLKKHNEDYMLSDLIIKLRNDCVDSSVKLEAYINKLHDVDIIHEIDFLSACDNSFDIIGLNTDDFSNIMKAIKQLNKYKNLIIFIDGYFNDFLQNIILNSNLLIYFKVDDGFSTFVEKKVLDNLKYFENINSANSLIPCYEQIDISHLNFEGDTMDVLSNIVGEKIWIKSKN